MFDREFDIWSTRRQAFRVLDELLLGAKIHSAYSTRQTIINETW